MNFDLADELNEYLNENRLGEAIDLTEKKFNKLPKTEFNNIINRNLKPLTENIVEYISTFYTNHKSDFNIKAIYSEMNGFTINYDLWFIDLFAYTEIGTLEDLDWLADFETSSDES
ncbi:hypothetical protein ACX3PU_09905 [Chryseobacterium sp. A301]